MININVLCSLGGTLFLPTYEPTLSLTKLTHMLGENTLYTLRKNTFAIAPRLRENPFSSLIV